MIHLRTLFEMIKCPCEITARTTLTNLSEVLVQLHDELRHFLESHLVADAVRRTGDLFLPLLDFHD